MSACTPRSAASRWCFIRARCLQCRARSRIRSPPAAVNVEGTLNVLLAARDEGIRRIVFASSSSVYGSWVDPRRVSRAPTPDRSLPMASRNSRPSATACSFSHVCIRSRRSRSATSTSSARIRILRRSTRRWCRASLTGKSQTEERSRVYGDGEQRRDFTYIENVVAANLLAAEAHDVNGAVLNIATGRSTTVNELAETIGSLLGRAVEKEELPARAGSFEIRGQT